ncbi:hypothetical protein ILUMI_08209 [Ignelater luminosus]|uniref:Ankyrin repeat protein n=1 Tax=Ignelater luminosus TaxID=2038154 RepID=A0A8K0GDL7_IGNLU|nr:hypothetical protein ILUMI_08209 [Ignelater luminosus]
MAKLLINRGADVNASNSNCDTCLHILINGSSNDFSDILDKLLSKGVCSDKKNRYGETPLHLSLNKRKLNAAKMLISNGADINTESLYKKSIIHAAVNTNNIEIVEHIFSKGASVSYADKSLIHLAVENNNMEMVKLLLCNGCDIDAKDKNGKTVLHRASESLQENVIKMLLDSGASINKCDCNGNTPLHLVVGLQKKRSYKYSQKRQLHLLKEKAEESLIKMEDPEIELGHQKRISVARFLISKGADVNTINLQSKTPIHYIFENELTDIVFEILDNKLNTRYKINFNIKDELGNTALYYGIRKNIDCIKKIILKGKVMINQQNDEHETLLHLATELGQLETVKFLCQNGADSTLKNKWGCTALCIAVNKKDILILTEFLKLENVLKIINEIDEDGKTVVHRAVENNFKDGLIIILEHGGDIDRCDNNGDTALHLAVQNNLVEIVKTLFDYQPDIDIWNSNKKTAQSLAYEIGNEEIIYLFQKYCIQLFCTTHQ